MENLATTHRSVAESLDRQHERIIGLLDALLKEPLPILDIELAADALTKVKRCAADHFHDEERLLARSAYPDMYNHKKLHQEFLEQIVERCLAATLRTKSMRREVLVYLRNWLHHHAPRGGR